MGYRHKPSRTKARAFAEEMSGISQFCTENGICQSVSSDSYYFSLNGKSYRVSNHTIAASNAGAYDFLGNKVREKYHGDNEDLVCITAGKTRIIQIYNDLKSGKKLDRRGYAVE